MLYIGTEGRGRSNNSVLGEGRAPTLILQEEGYGVAREPPPSPLSPLLMTWERVKVWGVKVLAGIKGREDCEKGWGRFPAICGWHSCLSFL